METEKMHFLFIIILLFLYSVSHAQNINLEKYKNKAQTITHIRIASASILPDTWDKEKNWKRIERMVKEAVNKGGADVVVTPEGVLEGYVINEVNNEKDLKKKQDITQKFFQLGEPIDGSYIKKACNLADELDIYFVLGFLERRDKKLFNSAILIDNDGDIIGKYSKTHFFQGYEINPDFYNAGDEYPVFDTPFGKVGIIICYDRQLPEPARILSVKGAQVLFAPSYGSYTDVNGWNTVLLRTRAYENSVPLVFSHPYQSLLIAANGDVKTMGNANEIVYYDINTDPAGYKDRFKNRKPSTYNTLIESNVPRNH